MGRLACAFAFMCLLATGCSLHSSSTAATSARTEVPTGSPLAPANRSLDAEVAMPVGFPADFPTYPHARLTAAASFPFDGQVAWGMEWESVDATTKVVAEFPKQFTHGDWALTPTNQAGQDFSATVSRKSNTRVSGTLAINNDVYVTRILVSLVIPT
jgi:hypothetical protein